MSVAVPVTDQIHPVGIPGLELGLRNVARFILQGMRDPLMIAWTRKAKEESGLPRGAPPSAIAQALYQRQKSEMAFVSDPVATELMMSAVELLCLNPDGYCIKGGDCANQVIVMGSALMCSGIPVQLVLRQYPQLDELHLMLRFDSDVQRRGQWACFDPSNNTGVCESGYDVQIIAEVSDMANAEPGRIITIGRPRRMGQPPTSSSSSTGSASLTPAQQGAWLVLLAQTQAKIAASAANLRAAAATLNLVRADLGLPAADPVGITTGGESEAAPGAPASSPLQAYVTSYQWTSDAQTAEGNLLQTADFLAGVLGDGVAGTRMLYWNAGDLYVTSQPGDPYGVLMKPDPTTGALVPQYVDLTSNAPSGRIGIAPILIGLAIFAASIAAAYAVSKICDYLAEAHRDDAMQHVATEQQALVAAGAQTPQQAAAFMRAAGDLASAPPPGAAPSTSSSLWPMVTAGALGIAAGLAIGLLPRFIPSVRFGSA